MSEDNFQKFPTNHDRKIAAEKKRREVASENAAFVVRLIPQMMPIAESYAQQCRKKNIQVQIRQSTQSLRFILTHSSGEERGLIGSLDFDRQNRLSFEQLSPRESGKRLRATVGTVYDAGNWSDDVYENLLRQFISNFDEYESRVLKMTFNESGCLLTRRNNPAAVGAGNFDEIESTVSGL